VQVNACGVCRTDLHLIEGELPDPPLPMIPGHQIVGTVAECGASARRFTIGERVGIPWLHQTCGTCMYCVNGQENLCDHARFTGYTAQGGYAEYVTVPEDFAIRLPTNFSDTEVAPLLCAGIVGYRSLRLSNLQPGERLGLYGFGGSAHICLQVARHWGCAGANLALSQLKSSAIQGAAVLKIRRLGQPAQRFNSAFDKLVR
jgi:alcohol dehydrogenase, propanol-preferring